MKRHVTDWEKIFTIQMSDKGLKLSRLLKKTVITQKKKSNSSVKRW